MRQASQRLAALLVVGALLPACGGGGSGGGGPAGPPVPTPAVVQLAAVTATVAEGGLTAVLTVNRVGGTGQTVTVQFATADVTATAGVDYTDSNGTLEWLEADFAPKLINVPVADLDALVEGEETFTVTLSAPGGATLGANEVATVTITDGDGPPEGVFQFSSLLYEVTEGVAGSVNRTITVRRTGALDTTEAASVDCVVANGTASGGTDFTVLGTVTLNWAIGDATDKTFDIEILNDGLDAAGVETILLTLQNPLPALGPEVSVSQGSATVEITDQDQFGQLEFIASNFQVSENAVTVDITVSRLNGAAGAVGASVALGGGASTAVAGTDYTDPGAINLAWAAGDTADKVFTITVIDNNIADGNRLLEMTLTPSGGATAGAPATLTITDEDAGILVFSALTYDAVEGAAATTTTLTITVDRLVGSAGAASVDVNIVAGSATLTTDYTVVNSPEVLAFADGETSKSFDITIVGDGTFEPDETIFLTLTNAVGASVGAPSSATATITNDDAPPGGTITLTGLPYAATEGVPGFTITVHREVGSVIPAPAVAVTLKSVNLTARGNGKKKDFNAVNQTVNFGVGIFDVIVPITIVDDTVVEVPETFRLQLSNPTNQSALGTPNTATVTITSNE
ncbi:MAG TPA: Calx-beta domain-containing protein [Planctomycetota bacterium]